MTPEANDRIDGFLGNLHRERSTDVHRLAAERLVQGTPLPNEIHQNLLRLFPSAERLRLVTTNFDRLFEAAANDVFAAAPTVHSAPALPVGDRFRGIVHVHGEINDPNEMVLTDEDFGRAYLTEGWAPRFLLDLFLNFTVLFVGYSHDDLIMNYLARALPVGRTRHRVALVRDGDTSHWDSLGIATAPFPVHSPDDYSGLYAGVKGLAEYSRRGLLEWRHEIKRLASKPPTISDEEVDIIQSAVSDPGKVRFFTESATHPEWIEWLDSRGLLDVVFDDTGAGPRSTQLSQWLASTFSCQSAEYLFLLIARHNMQVSRHFWDELGKSLATEGFQIVSDDVLARWVSMFCAMAPPSADCHWLVRLAKGCVDRKLFDVALVAFDAISQTQLDLEPGVRHSDETRRIHPPEMEANLRCLGKPEEIKRLCASLTHHLDQLAEPLLVRLSDLLVHRHEILCAWQHGETGESDDDDTQRSAIEPHEQNRQREGIDFLIDTARDSLDWLVNQEPAAAARWTELLLAASCPLLRRLAVHGLANRTNLTSDERIEVLLDRVGLDDKAVRHEIFRLVRLAYPTASSALRERLINEVSLLSLPNDDDPQKEIYEAQYRLNWLFWIRGSDPNCSLIEDKYTESRRNYPELEPSAHPDLDYWIGKPVLVNPRSPWSVNELLQDSPAGQLERLIQYRPGHPFDPNRTGLLNNVTESARQEFKWGILLAESLASSKSWSSDLWMALFDAWKVSNLTEDAETKVLFWIEDRDLQKAQLESISDVLFELAKKWRASQKLDLLDRVSDTAGKLWADLPEEEVPPNSLDWLMMAMNHPSGHLTIVRIECLAAWEQKYNPSPSERALKYQETLSTILEKRGLPGVLGRSIIASQLPLILTVNEGWAKKKVVPLFSEDTSDPNFWAAWDGFLYWGSCTPAVIEALRNASVETIQWIQGQPDERRRMFVEYYTTFTIYAPENPLSQLVPYLFEFASVEEWCVFAQQIGMHLNECDPERVRDLWHRWLKSYWENRNRGKPRQLDQHEVTLMWYWIQYLEPVLDEAAELITETDTGPSDIEMEQVIHTLNKMDLIEKHPNLIAELLIHLGKHAREAGCLVSAREVIARLQDQHLLPEMVEGIRELDARIG